jgi:hypothetical protein
MGSGATKFTGASSYHLLSTLNFSGFISLGIRGYKINNITKLLGKIISIESYTRNMDLKILPEPRYVLDMFQKNYQVLRLPDKLIMHLTLHELTY